MKKRALLSTLPLFAFSTLLVGCLKGGGPISGAGGGQFSLTGTISGLTNSGLVLADGTTTPPNTVNPTSGSTSFGFQSSTGYLSIGQQYNVTVQQQPIGETCSVANGSGTVSGVVTGANGVVVSNGNITNVAVTCKAPTINTVLSSAAYANVTSSQSVNGATSIAVGKDGTIYVADQFSGSLFKVTQPTTATAIPLINGSNGAIKNPGIQQIAMDANGNLYAAVNPNGAGAVIEKISITTGAVTVIAGSGTEGEGNGSGTSATFGNLIRGLTIDATGNIYVADFDSNFNSHTIRKITQSGVVTTLAGAGAPGSVNGTGTGASFNMSAVRGNALTHDNLGNVYLVEWVNNDVRQITPAGVVTTYAGSTKPGASDGPATNGALFNSPSSITIDANNNLYVLDGDGFVRMIMPSGYVSTLVGAGVPTYDINHNVISNGGLANASCLAIDSVGNLYTTTWGSSTALLEVTFQ